MSASFTGPVLIGDIGGTNARFALVEGADRPLRRICDVTLESHEADSPPEQRMGNVIARAIEAGSREGLPAPATVMLAVATPLSGDAFTLTNNAAITIRPALLNARFGLTETVMLNDFAAQALAAVALGPGDLVPIGPPLLAAEGPRVVIGPGTGLGVGMVLPADGRWVVVPGEGGHVDVGPRGAREARIWSALWTEGGRVSAEMVISGQGIQNLYRAICIADGMAAHAAATPAGDGDDPGAGPLAGPWAARIGDPEDAPQVVGAALVSRRAGEGEPQAREAIDLFFRLLARVAGDLALVSLARGGVFVTGGIPGRNRAHLDEAAFRAEFANKWPHEAKLAGFPVFLFDPRADAALAGMAALVREPGRFVLDPAAMPRFPG